MTIWRCTTLRAIWLSTVNRSSISASYTCACLMLPCTRVWENECSYIAGGTGFFPSPCYFRSVIAEGGRSYRIALPESRRKDPARSHIYCRVAAGTSSAMSCFFGRSGVIPVLQGHFDAHPRQYHSIHLKRNTSAWPIFPSNRSASSSVGHG